MDITTMDGNFGGTVDRGLRVRVWLVLHFLGEGLGGRKRIALGMALGFPLFAGCSHVGSRGSGVG